MASIQRLPVTCTKCGHKFSKSVSGLKGEPQFACPRCGQRFDAKQFLVGLKKVEKAQADLVRKIRKSFGG